MGLIVNIVPVTSYAQNCSVIMCENTKSAAIVDPGGDIEQVLAVLEEMGGKLEKILLTHGHMDHVGGTDALAKQTGVPVIGPHEEDDFWIQNLPNQAKMFGFPDCQAFVPTQWLHDGDQVTVGEVTLDVIHTPGHTPGHVVFHSKEDKLAFVGDVLFSGSIGRTDFPKGDYATLISSIKEKLWPLGEDVTFIPGHGPTSTFGEEMRSNPFVAGKAG